ncbi:4-coumarate--CoA ligase-like 7 [Temnothorax curvispinosus]|uniref:4-coumarate--CoA ligase-like 7 n=1 Tax=Temnothorax curvispinosus TaxID=300111 RepID=A0A6J1R2I5_9HYME|nr:4-coumarate--CoA ligase-like 7 [Temnothorax curvispinosus]
MAELDISNKMVEHVSKNFTVENGVYKGKAEHKSNNYKSVGEMLWTNIRNHGNNIAYLDAQTEKTVTYAQLQNKVVRCALWLQKQGIKSGDVISLCTNNHLNSIVPCLSATYINAISNPWYENMDLQTAMHVLELTTPKVIFCNEKSVDVVLSAIKDKNFNPTVVIFGKHVDAISFSDILNNCNDAEVSNFRYIELDDIQKTACILHSSGTTGLTKGVELSNYYVLIFSQENKLKINNAPSLWFSSLYWLSGIILNFNAIVNSSKVILYPEFDEEMTCQLIEKYKAGFVFLSSSMLNRFLKAGYVKKYSLLSLETISYDGATTKSKVQEELRRILPHVQILQIYAMTETGLITMQLPNHKNGSCGTVTKNVQIKIVDLENGKVLGPNQSGEIWIKSLTLMTGYYRNPEATKSTVDEEGWLHSGDIGYFDDDGELFIVDRIKELIKYRGYQIAPGEIEDVLMSHPAVLEVAVIGIPHELDDEHPLAFVTKRSNVKVTEQELMDFVSKNVMDHFKLRAGVIFLDAFPYTSSGKIARKDLLHLLKTIFLTCVKIFENY